MKKVLLLITLVAGISHYNYTAPDGNALTIYGFTPTGRLGLVKTALFSVGAYLALPYCNDRDVRACVKRLCAGLLAKEATLAITDSEPVGKAVVEIPSIGKPLQNFFFTCPEEQKGILACLIGALTAIMVPIVR